ncbi:heme ABC transporter ATP-binding protein [Nocardia cyriacigeorgica]|uniref:Hemin import ATP-binding protein hmuV n=1 Tax=Nocardia cyriacigeorgica (strain GUH-2) TaxID=1127134 RepID=H6R7Z2_NOCCG|nr:hemin import ATP-binding protein HmuV [Nocardia cyriacigeorgica]BDU06691.1 hemin import ATP-binding protein HmuV [Nocardia cyriacigeorgica]CCF63536.1 Hemin import ATP-binding protein hmuV [Nocardia cyriacigeorgica GUH-2]
MTGLKNSWEAVLSRAHELPSTPAPGTVTLRARGVSVERRGGGAKPRRVLADVDFEVAAGEVVALVGPNGAGKSTLLAVLAGELEPTEGSVELDGRAVTEWTPLDMARRRAVLPQSHTVGFPFSAGAVVAMGRAPWQRTALRERDDEIIAASMAATDVTHLSEQAFPTLSGGERARVALARVLAQDTATLLLDEPTAALDLGHQEAVLRLADQRAEAGAAVVVVLHDLGVAAAYADRVAVLDNGRIAADGPPREVLTTDLLTRVYQYPVEVLDHPVTGAQLVLPARGGGVG